MMDRVIIGVDLDKLAATIGVVDRHGVVLGSGRFGTDRAGYTATRLDSPANVSARPSRQGGALDRTTDLAKEPVRRPLTSLARCRWRPGGIPNSQQKQCPKTSEDV